MADNSAARLAAGRNLLKNFQVKKKGSDKSDTPLKQNVNHVQPTSIPETTVATDLCHQFSHSMDNTTNHNMTMLGENSGRQIDNNYFKDNLRSLPISDSGVDFFDHVQSSTNIMQSQKANDTTDSFTSDDNLPMAGVLFGNQINDGTRNHQSINHEMQKSFDSDLTQTSAVQNDNCMVFTKNTVEHETDMKSLVEISRLQQQLQFAQKSVEFLVSEKNEMTAKVNELEKTIVAVKSQTEDVSGRLNISRHRASHLEMECSNLKQKNKEMESQYLEAMKEVTEHKSTRSAHHNRTKELEEEILEMKSLMSHKMLENKNLQKIVEDMTFQINTNELKLQQLTQGNIPNINADEQAFRAQYHKLEDQVNILKQQVDELEYEKAQSSQEYQQYVQHLNNQVALLNEKQFELTSDNENLMNREANLIQQVDELQNKLQIQLTYNNSQDSKPSSQSGDVILKENFDKLEVENNNLKEELQKRQLNIEKSQQEIHILKDKIDELTNSIHILQTDRPDAAKLNAANESDRLAAQKATAQNTKMKIHLQELEEAFGKMTNSKLEMAELLQAEKNLTKMLTLKLAENEENLKEIQVKVIAKDEEMIRLQALSSDQDKEIQKQSKLLEQTTIPEANGRVADTLQVELDSARNQLALLIDENTNLRKLQNGDVHHNSEDCDGDVSKIETHCHQHAVNNHIINKMPSTEAMEKLQNRFTKLMKEVADLSDEKQGLEHLVLQLQGETETICEYIALYQKQRNILKQRENERNLQLTLLDKERQHMKDKIEQVNQLIQQLVVRNNITKDSLVSGNLNNETPTETSLAAEKIMGLLTEIKTSHLIEPSETCSGLENFNPCPWCSGKLINV